jgi:VWFA-related protein
MAMSVGAASPFISCNISIPFAAYDAGHHLVSNLSASDFEITEGAFVRQVRSVEMDSRPLLLAVVVDSSRGMKGSAEAVAEALRNFGSTGSPKDLTALITFSGEARLTVPFTRDFSKILAGAERTAGQGASALFDAIAFAVGQLGNRTDFRRVMLIFSDGRDNASGISYASLRESVRQSGIVLHTLAIRGWLDQQSPVNQMLRALSEESGGVYLVGESVKDWPRLAGQLNLRQQYLLTVEGAPPDDRYHRIRLRVKSSEVVQVRSPRGYFSHASGVCP